ncbi:16S rRNA (guanine(966)-N(2))-methyltransferase RsmD [candidate division WWE3 bacterium CG_4_9_14_0_2_um_filter_35_11]|uniref:16S rRNA (Guanine(966)-N(2))-methyltransferase RsmD n=1 Tax=candidate division WWE3 bacterium CG_4_9_14_0_2_um_filter_35_11 TaxID=1975077 RepID=A0A2M8EMA3_UNCKA|nr:MAG: 16S rRNA (guanine(966)-N(2))-methyltransferase RsmD [candidate division WWE3 bacterium CG10_big_fil_rev_8_21_14_0_10_35_32]PJC23859.1 MAG: 16S rRNA (guanine(966)-N(2))-methyltransferase RsmD [candidate division WWE3 bacterium CG_4_9_14_0_2_um_filter_35_11]
MELRISGGIFKNKKIKVPESAKPVRDRVKLAIFSIIGEKIASAQCLDLFAGSGNLGLEALSRGALSCTFVDNDYYAIKAIKDNIENVNLENSENINTIKDESVKFISSQEKTFDIIFIDAPYDLPIKHIFKVLPEIMTNESIIVYFHGFKKGVNAESENKLLKIYDSRKYGITQVDFIKLSLLDI